MCLHAHAGFFYGVRIQNMPDSPLCEYIFGYNFAYNLLFMYFGSPFTLFFGQLYEFK